MSKLHIMFDTIAGNIMQEWAPDASMELRDAISFHLQEVADAAANDGWNRGAEAMRDRASEIAKGYGRSSYAVGFRTEETNASEECADAIQNDIRALPLPQYQKKVE